MIGQGYRDEQQMEAEAGLYRSRSGTYLPLIQIEDHKYSSRVEANYSSHRWYFEDNIMYMCIFLVLMKGSALIILLAG